MNNVLGSSLEGLKKWPLHELKCTIENAWDVGPNTSHSPAVRTAVEATLSGLDCGRIRVAERDKVGEWTVNKWVKKAVLLSFRLSDNKLPRAGGLSFFDKVASKFANPDEDGMRAIGVCVTPPAVARRGSF